MTGPFKMKGWSPFTKKTDPKTSEIEVHQESAKKAVEVRKPKPSSELFTEKYGGTWTKKDGQWKNERDQTVRERENELASAEVEALKKKT